MPSQLTPHRVADAANAIRPDWPVTSIETLLRNPAVTRRPLPDTAVALIRLALDPSCRTPGPLLHPGPWWDNPHGDTTQQADRHPSAARLAQVIDLPRDLPDPQPRIETLRAILREAKARASHARTAS